MHFQLLNYISLSREDGCQSPVHLLRNMGQTMECKECNNSNEQLTDYRLEETSWVSLWGQGEGWICHEKGVLMLPHSSACCCGQTRNFEVKFLLQKAMEGFETTSVPEPELMGAFDIKRILRAILMTPELVNKIHLGRTRPIHLLDIMCPQDDMESGDGLGPELMEVTDEGNGNLLVDNASDQLPMQNSRNNPLNLISTKRNI